MAQRSGKCRLHNCLLQQYLKLVDVWEVCSAFYPELDHAGILAARTVKFYRKLLVLCHSLIEHLWQSCGFLVSKLL